MAYFIQDDLTPKVGGDVLLETLDDNEDGVVDAALFAALVAAVESEIDGFLEARYGRFTVSVPAAVNAAAVALACEALYKRRGVAKSQNPWADDATRVRDLLGRIGRGEDLLAGAVPLETAGGLVITENCRSYASDGRLMH